jgi:hypothetical protein
MKFGAFILGTSGVLAWRRKFEDPGIENARSCGHFKLDSAVVVLRQPASASAL